MMLVYCQSGTRLAPSKYGLPGKYYQDTDTPAIINAAEIVDIELRTEKYPSQIIIRTSNRQYTFYKNDDHLNESVNNMVREMYVRLIQSLTDFNDGILITAVPHPELLRTSSHGKIMTNCLWNPGPSQQGTA